MQFLDVIDALQDIGDVINSPFLYSQLVDSVVKIDGAILALFDEFYEFFCEDREAVVLSSLPYLTIKSTVGRRFFFFIVLLLWFFYLDWSCLLAWVSSLHLVCNC